MSTMGGFGADIAIDSGALPLPGGERVGVRGFGWLLAKRAQDDFKHTVRIAEDIVVPEAEDEVTHRFEDFGSILVVRFAGRVLATVEFHNQLGICTDEVDDVAIDRHLPFELPIGKSARSQTKPQYAFRIRLMMTQSLR